MNFYLNIKNRFQPGPLTNRQYTQCLCTHLSDFASSFFVPPNSIDFSTVFTKFKNLGDNAAVFSTCFALFGVYLILLVWLRRKDKQDVIKVYLTNHIYLPEFCCICISHLS